MSTSSVWTMAPAVAALRVADASSASAGTVANASAQTPIQAASRPMLLVDMEILWRGGREGISDAWRGKKFSGGVRPGSCGRWPPTENEMGRQTGRDRGFRE